MADPPTVVEAPLGFRWLEAGIAGYGLRDARAKLPDRPLDPAQWDGLLHTVERQRLAALLARAVDDGLFPATTEQAEQVSRMEREAISVDLLLEARLIATADLLTRQGICSRVLKGAATAHRIYPDPSLRSFRDVDVLVAGSDFGRAVVDLVDAGGIRSYAEARPGFDGRFSKGASFEMPDGLFVDLHRTFVLGPYGFLVDLDGVLGRSGSFRLAGRDLACLEHHDAFLHACIHAALGDWPPRLVPIRDVAQFLQDGEIEAPVVLERAASWRVSAVVARALGLAVETLRLGGDDPLLAWAASYRPQPWERRTMALYGPGHTYRRQALAATRFVPGWSRLAYLRDLALPSRDYVSERDGSYIRRWARAAGTRARGRAARGQGEC